MHARNKIKKHYSPIRNVELDKFKQEYSRKRDDKQNSRIKQIRVTK